MYNSSKIFCFSIICVAVLLAGCATPIGQIPESDFTWQEKQVNLDYQEVHRNLVRGYRSCVSSSAESYLDTENKKAQFDVYLRNSSSMTRYVLGVIQVNAISENSSNIRVGVQTIYDKPIFGKEGKMRLTIFGMAEGDTSCSNGEK